MMDFNDEREALAHIQHMRLLRLSYEIPESEAARAFESALGEHLAALEQDGGPATADKADRAWLLAVGAVLRDAADGGRPLSPRACASLEAILANCATCSIALVPRFGASPIPSCGSGRSSYFSAFTGFCPGRPCRFRRPRFSGRI